MTDPTLPTTIRIDARFNGPNTTGNGGYVSGLLATDDGVAHTVELRSPPPLDRELTRTARDGRAELRDGETLVATATAGELALTDPLLTPVSAEAARTASDAYPGFSDHPFPRCFTCGSDRGPGDGLQVFSGPLPDGRTACEWRPHPEFGDATGRLAPEFLWAALDCPGGWAMDIRRTPAVLARMTARLVRRPRIDEPCIAIGALRETVRRKHYTATALYSDAGELLGRADQLWVAIDPAKFR